MKQTLQVPILGSSVRRETSYPVATDNGYATVGATPPPITTPATNSDPSQHDGYRFNGEAPTTSAGTSPTPAPPRREPQTPLESFHPALSNKDITFDEKTKQIRIRPRVEEAAAETQDEGVNEDGENELPALGEQHASAVDAVTQTTQQPTSEVAELRAQLAQQGQMMQAMLVAQATGKPLAEVLGLQPTPTAEPDYSDYDLYEPDQRAEFIRRIKQDVKAEVMREHQPTMEASRRRMEYDNVAAKYGSESNFQQKAIAAIQLVQDNPALTIEQAYATVNKIQQSLGVNGTPQVAAPANGAKQATRTITPEQAAAKAEQAKKLPGNSGVNGAGPAPAPAHFGIGDLGKMMLWDLQQASRR